MNKLYLFERHANFTCMFSIGSEVRTTRGRMETMPLGALYDMDATNDMPTHVICHTPETRGRGKGQLKVSPNGYDFTGGLEFEFTPNLELFRIVP